MASVEEVSNVFETVARLCPRTRWCDVDDGDVERPRRATADDRADVDVDHCRQIFVVEQFTQPRRLPAHAPAR